jgi:hypothetical protein
MKKEKERVCMMKRKVNRQERNDDKKYLKKENKIRNKYG